MNYKINSRSFLIIFLTIMMFVILQPITVFAEEALDIDAESAILVDAETGKILYEKDRNTALPSASMTKMMTEYLVWEAIESGKIDWDTTIKISDYAFNISANITFSGVGLYKDVDYTVQSLYEAMAINSDNATTIALAELIAGSEGEFVKLMNEKGNKMGLPDFKFVNSTGLDNTSLGENYPEGTESDGINLLSAETSALLAYYLIKDYPESLTISSIPEIEFDDKMIRNWNWMLPHEASFLKPYHYEGVDGLKTGFTELAGYSFTGTAERDNRRLISVVMKTDSEGTRFEEMAKIFDYGFSKFEETELFPSGYQLKEESSLPVIKGKEKEVEISTKDPINLLIKKGEEDKYKVKHHFDETKINENGELTAPIKKNEKIGSVELVYEGEKDYGFIITDVANETVDLIAIEEVEKKNWFMILIGTIGNFFVNLYTSIVDMIKGWF